MDIKVLGIDLGKIVCSLAGLDGAGAVVFRKRLQRHRLLPFLIRFRPALLLWKPVAAHITSGAFVFRMGMSLD